MADAFRRRFKIVTLNPADYIMAINSAAEAGESGGAIFDCLHLACARKVGATRILTLDVADFRRLAPDLADRIFAP